MTPCAAPPLYNTLHCAHHQKMISSCVRWWPGPGLAWVQAQAFTDRLEGGYNQALENTGKR